MPCYLMPETAGRITPMLCGRVLCVIKRKIDDMIFFGLLKPVFTRYKKRAPASTLFLILL